MYIFGMFWPDSFYSFYCLIFCFLLQKMINIINTRLLMLVNALFKIFLTKTNLYLIKKLYNLISTNYINIFYFIAIQCSYLYRSKYIFKSHDFQFWFAESKWMKLVFNASALYVHSVSLRGGLECKVASKQFAELLLNWIQCRRLAWDSRLPVTPYAVLWSYPLPLLQCSPTLKKVNWEVSLLLIVTIQLSCTLTN